MKNIFVLFLLVCGSAFAQMPAMPPVDRSQLPAAARNLRLDRLSSGALMLLDRDHNLVMPRAISAKGTTSSEAAETTPVQLDLRIGPNIRLGNDPAALPPGMMAQAEPHIMRSIVNDDYLTAAFQEGRFTTGGAVDVGYSTSHDGGLTWSRILLPNLTMASGGPYFRGTDPVVGYDLSDNVYVVTDDATDTNFDNGVIAVSKSSNSGTTFANPVEVYRPPNSNNFPDKPWIAVNNFPSTPTTGRVLVTFTLFSNTTNNLNPIYRSYSDNGGATWSSIANVTGTGSSVQGSQPAYLPNGNCVLVYWNFGTSAAPGERLEARISTDGGVTFGNPQLISYATEWNEPAIRSGGFLPAITVDRTNGSIHVVYQTVLNGSPRIAYSKSTDGGVSWTTPIAISDNPSGLGVFNPAIGAAPGGRTLSAVFYDHRDNPSSQTLVNMYLAQSFDGGVTWQPNIRISSVTTDASLAPLTSSGYMLGDYLGVANSTMETVPAVPVWVDTRTGNPDPFVTRAGIAPTEEFAPAWEAAYSSLANIPATSIRPESTDLDRDGEDTVAENAVGTDPLNYASVTRTAREQNLSSRLHVGTGEDVGIIGFIISGSASKTVLIRALGPTLALFGVPDVLQDPTIELYNSSNTEIAFDDNWKDSQQAQIQATGRAPNYDSESALLVTLAPGSYTAILRGAGNTTGSALLEVYDQDNSSASVLSNLSSRAFVGTGDLVAIGGFIVGGGKGTNGDGSSEVLVRALGPELTGFGIANALQDPILSLYDGNGNQIAINDNWQDTQQAAISATGKAPGDARESAILTTLIQGNWTAILSGKNGATGVGLVEVYRIH